MAEQADVAALVDGVRRREVDPLTAVGAVVEAAASGKGA
jgi:hypothetical protein